MAERVVRRLPRATGSTRRRPNSPTPGRRSRSGARPGGTRPTSGPSTHPGRGGDVADTDEALLNFDGISYAKGASVLRQLVAWLGDDVFFAGLRAHFAAHAYGNATLADLLAALGGGERPGPVRMGARLAADRRRSARSARSHRRRRPVRPASTSSRRAPAADGAPVLRPHRINIGALRVRRRRRTLRDRSRVEIDRRRRRVPASTALDRSARAADLLLLNDGDLTYAKIRLDARRPGRARGPCCRRCATH